MVEQVSTASLGKGVRLQRGTGNSPEAAEDIGEILEISGPSFARDAVETTHSQSPGGYREFISGLRDGGEISATIALVPSGTDGDPHKEIFDDYKNASRVTYRMLFPDAVTYFLFDGLVTSLDHATPIDDRMTLAVTIKISGEPELLSLA